MKKTINFTAILAAFLFSIYACEFSPSEIPMTEIEEPSSNPPDVWIELIPEMDTLRLSEPTWITYTVETGANELYRIVFQIDDVEFSSLNYESAEKVNAYINTELMEDGIHELKITTFTSTNSGSITDKIGAEQYWYEIKWPVFVNKQAKENFTFNILEFVPEGIKVSWPEYRYADFDRYELSWNFANYQNEQIDITDPYQNSYINDTYIEGCYIQYAVFIYYKSGGFKFDHLTYYKEIKKPIVQINEDCIVDIQWTHSNNEQHVKLYCIKTEAPNYGTDEEHDITDLNDTTFSLNEKIGFGGDYQVQLRYIPQGYNGYHTFLTTAGGLTTFALGDSLPRFQKAFLVTAENSMLIYTDGVFSKYDYYTGESSASISFTPLYDFYNRTVTASPDGNYFGYFENQEYVVRRSIDMSVVNKLDVEAYNGYNLVLNDISISNNGLIATADYNNNLRIFNITTGAKIFERHYNTGFYLRKAMISPDGQHLAIMLIDYDLNTTFLIYFSFDGDQLTELGRVNGVGHDVDAVLAYSPQSGQKLIVSRWRASYSSNVEVRDSRTFELLHSVEVPNYFVPIAYDFTADQVIAQYQSSPTVKYSYLIDLKTGNKNKIVQFTGRESFVFTGGIVFSGIGRSIEIDDYIIE